MSALHTPHRLTVDQVLRMVATGILSESDRCELLNGELIEMAPKGPLHRVLAIDLQKRLDRVIGGDVHTCVEQPLVCGAHSLPEPDVSVVVGRPRDYLQGHPRGDQATLVVEVAVTSIAEDREKAKHYAVGNAPVYWILDVMARTLEVHTGPMPDGRYRSVIVLTEDETVPVPGTDQRWRVADLLP